MDIKIITGLRNWFQSYGLVILAVIMWSFSEILQKLLQDTVPPMSKSFFRFFIGTLSLGIIMGIQRDWQLGDLWRRNRWDLLIAGVIGFGIGNFVYFLGVEQTQANIGAAIYGTYPLFISIYSIWILNERQYLRRRFLGYMIGFIGIAILLSQGQLLNFINPIFITGNLLVLAGSAIWSIFSVLGKRITSQERNQITNIDLKFNFVTMGLAGLTNLVFLLLIPSERKVFFNYPPISWIYLIILGVITTGLGTWLFFVGIKRLELSRGIGIAMLKPIFVIIFAFFILGEIPSSWLIISIPLIFVATYLVTVSPKEIINS